MRLRNKVPSEGGANAWLPLTRKWCQNPFWSHERDFRWSIIKTAAFLSPPKTSHSFHGNCVALSAGGCSAFLGKPLKWELVRLITATCLMTFFTCRLTATVLLSRQYSTYNFLYLGFDMTSYLSLSSHKIVCVKWWKCPNAPRCLTSAVHRKINKKSCRKIWVGEWIIINYDNE